MTLNIAFSRMTGAVIVLAGVTVAGLLLLAAATADRVASRDELEAKTAFQGRSLAAVRRNGAQPAPSGQALSLVADSASLATARVETLLRATLAEAGSVVLSSRAEVREGTPARGGPAGRIEVQAVARGTMEALQAGLFKLETGRPLVLLDSVELRVADEDTAAPQAPSPMLTATLTASMFWKSARAP